MRKLVNKENREIVTKVEEHVVGDYLKTGKWEILDGEKVHKGASNGKGSIEARNETTANKDGHS